MLQVFVHCYTDCRRRFCLSFLFDFSLFWNMFELGYVFEMKKKKHISFWDVILKRQQCAASAIIRSQNFHALLTLFIEISQCVVAKFSDFLIVCTQRSSHSFINLQKNKYGYSLCYDLVVDQLSPSQLGIRRIVIWWTWSFAQIDSKLLNKNAFKWIVTLIFRKRKWKIKKKIENPQSFIFW